MSLTKNLMKNLSDWVPKERNTLKTTDADSGWHVLVTADRCDALACQLWELTLSRSEAPANQKLGDWADDLAAKTIGQLDTIRVIEVDNDLQKAILRSASPVERDAQLLYFEIVLNGTTEATLRRYQANRDGHTREQILFVLTHETLANLVGSITS